MARIRVHFPANQILYICVTANIHFEMNGANSLNTHKFDEKNGYIKIDDIIHVLEPDAELQFKQFEYLE